jgi:hypothetical protein
MRCLAYVAGRRDTQLPDERCWVGFPVECLQVAHGMNEPRRLSWSKRGINGVGEELG